MKKEIHMMDRVEGLTQAQMQNLTEQAFRHLADQCIRKGDMESLLLLMDAYPRFADRYLLEEQ